MRAVSTTLELGALGARISAFGFVVLALGCEKSETFQDWTLETLSADEGFTLRSDVFEVASGEERQDCYFVQVPDLNGGRDFWVSRFTLAQNPGSHHFNVFRVRTRVRDANDQIKLGPEIGEDVDLGGTPAKLVRGGPAPRGECWKSANWADWPLVANTQASEPGNPYTDWQLPENVAARFTPGEWLMLQTHYVNATTQKTPFKGRVGINFHRFAGSGEPSELGTLFATQQNIRVCRSNPTPSYSGTCRFPVSATPITITAVNGHFHSRGRAFDVYTWDGTSEESPTLDERIYQSTRFDDPPMVRGLSVPAPPRGGIRWTCRYQWAEPELGCDAVDARDAQRANDCCFTFGPVVETSEHCNVFLYYYPKVTSDVACF